MRAWSKEERLGGWMSLESDLWTGGQKAVVWSGVCFM